MCSYACFLVFFLVIRTVRSCFACPLLSPQSKNKLILNYRDNWAIIEDTEQHCAKLVKFTSLQCLNESVQFYLSNTKEFYFSHLHYRNWWEIIPFMRKYMYLSMRKYMYLSFFFIDTKMPHMLRFVIATFRITDISKTSH